MCNINSEDRLAELEKKILEYFLAKGRKLAKDQKEGDKPWTFNVQITSSHKKKNINITLTEDGQFVGSYSNTEPTLKDMYDTAFLYFNHLNEL